MNWISIVGFIFAPRMVNGIYLVIVSVSAIYFVRFRRNVTAEIAQNPFYKALKAVAITLGSFSFSGIAFLSIAQYAMWSSAGSPSSRLLPPHQPITYFLGYAWLHFAKAPVFSAAVAVLLFLAMILLNKLSGARFFYREEPLMAAISVFAASWPGGLIVMTSVLALGVLGQALYWGLGRQGRMPLVYFWLPSGISVLLFGGTMEKLLGLTQFRT